MFIKKAVFFIIGVFFSLRVTAQPHPLAQVPFILNNDHIIIQIHLGNSGPLNFLFDSGAGGTLISKEVADSLGFTYVRQRKNVGVSGAHEVGVIKGVKLTLADLKVGNITLLSTDTPLEELDDGRKVHGVIGYPILAKYVVAIDYAAMLLSLYNRNTYSYQGKGQVLPIDLVYNIPLAKATITLYNGTEFTGNFLVDTGARSDVIISSPTVVNYAMAENVGKHYTVRRRIGSSQRRTKMRYGRLQSIQFARYKFEHIPVALSSDNRGVLSINALHGIIGNRLLQRFNIIFDYHKGQLYLEPSVLIGSRYKINASGLDITFKKGKPFITNIIDRSPADKAGLRPNDEIVAIHGQPVTTMQPAEIRQVFFQQKGKVELVVRRNNKLKYTEFTLHPLL